MNKITVAIVPSFRIDVPSYSSYARLALDAAKINGASIGEVRILTEGAPLAADWAAQTNVKAPRIAIEAVWPREDNDVPNKKAAAITRNEALLKGVETIFVYGKVESRSMVAVLRRVFGSPRNRVIQVLLGVAKAVGKKTIVCAPGYEVDDATVVTPNAHAYSDPFGADAAEAAQRKHAKK